MFGIKPRKQIWAFAESLNINFFWLNLNMYFGQKISEGEIIKNFKACYLVKKMGFSQCLEVLGSNFKDVRMILYLY